MSQRVPQEVREDSAVRGGLESQNAYQGVGREGVEEAAGEHAEGAVVGDGTDTGATA